jgi:putative glutamine amidotransferase
MKPLIGILLRKKENNKVYSVNKEIIDMIKNKANIIGIFIDNYKETIKLCNGIIIPGGNKIDNDSLKLIKYLYDNNIPTLGICLGMQEMGYSFNGEFNKESNYEHLKENMKYAHEIYIDKNSYLYNILKENKILVNSRHKDYLIKTNLTVSSISNVIESIEDKNKKFFIGLQWHPESINDINTTKIVEEFIKKSS